MIVLYFLLLILLSIIIFNYRSGFKLVSLAIDYEKKPSSDLFDKAQRGNGVEILYSAFPFAVIFLVVKSLFFDVITIPSGSMLPNFPIGSMVFVNKTTFGVRSPITGAPITKGHYPVLGEAVISRFPLNPDILYIKRVVGLPGDTVELTKKALIINNKKYPITLIGEKEIMVQEKPVLHFQYKITIEDLTYKIIADKKKDFPTFKTVTVAEKSFFLLGDNITASGDSRIYGSVPWSYFIGSIII